MPVLSPSSSSRSPVPHTGTLLVLGDIVTSIGALLDDPASLEFDQPYCLPFIHAAWKDIAVELAGLGLHYEEVVTAFTLPAGTTDLKSLQESGQPLEAMMLPVKLEWKRLDAPDIEYREIPQTKQLPDASPEADAPEAWEFRQGTAFLTPGTQDVTLRIRYKAYLVDFADASDGITLGAGNILAYKACELICAPTVRNNPQGMAFFAAKAREAADNFESLCVKNKLSETLRFGRIHGHARRASRYVARVTP